MRDLLERIEKADQALSVLRGFAPPEAAIQAEACLEELRAAAERLRRMDEDRTSARASLEAKGTLLRAVSHDMRESLGVAFGLAELLEEHRDLPADRRREIVHHLCRSCRRLVRLVSDLLDLDRIEQDTLSVERRPADLAALARRAVADIEEGERVVVDAAETIALVEPVWIERILDNLVANALKFSSGPVTVHVAREIDGVLLSVDDQGPGVRDDLKEAIFDPFVRGEPGAVTGTGIGLALVAKFAELHGGRAWVEDRPGGGSSFRVLLPDA